MRELAEKYRVVHQQGFVPIFVSDRFDAVQLAEAGVAAGAKAIEVTCRRQTVCQDIRRIRAAFPDLLVLVGSIVDDGPMLRFLQRRRGDMPGIGQLCDLGVDGFVSAMPLSLETIAKLSRTHLVVPGVETVGEAVQAVQAGAHFAKLWTIIPLGEHRRVELATCAAMHGLLPIFATGGITRDKIEAYVVARAATIGTGWGVMLGDRYESMQDHPSTVELAALLRGYLETMGQARSKHCHLPNAGSTREYLAALPHYHPFDEKAGM